MRTAMIISMAAKFWQEQELTMELGVEDKRKKSQKKGYIESGRN